MDAPNRELLRYLILVIKYKDENLRPSRKVDILWKNKILETKKYAKLCEDICKKLNMPPKFIHRKNLGFSDEDKKKYTRTLELLNKEFGTTSQEYWPSVLNEFNGFNNFNNFNNKDILDNRFAPEFGYTKVYWNDYILGEQIFKFKNGKYNYDELLLLIQEKTGVQHYDLRLNVNPGPTTNYDNSVVKAMRVLRGC